MNADRAKEIGALSDRITSRIAREDNGCWTWLGTKTPKGYGQTSSKRLGQKKMYTHRIMFEHSNGPISNGLQVDHLCRNPSCCNPAHLEAVTPRENTIRGESPRLVAERHRAISVCPHGHDYTPENTHTDNRGARSCKECRKIQHKKWDDKRKEAAARHRKLTAKSLAIRSV